MRIATFNIENLDTAPPGRNDPTWEERVHVLRPQLLRLRADVLLLQEVHGQDDPDGGPRTLSALQDLLQGTGYESYQVHSTLLADGRSVERYRNLVTLVPAAWTIEEGREVLHEFTPAPAYDAVTETGDRGPKEIRWDRPLLYTRVTSPVGPLHLLNVHWKSKRPTRIPGQGPEDFKWRTAAGWAEGFFLSSMKRVGAALEARVLIDSLFANDPDAMIVLGGDMNAESEEVPVRTVRGEIEDHGNPALNGQVMFPCEDSVPEDARFTLYHHGRRNMLDHLLVSRHMMGAYLGVQIHNEQVRDESIAFATDRKYPGSDHAPVVAEFDDAILGRGAST